jgi:hypothetical protein
VKEYEYLMFVVYLFIYLALQLGQSHHNSICQLLWALLPNPPCQLSLWEETGVPGENPRLLGFDFYSFHMKTGFESHWGGSN